MEKQKETLDKWMELYATLPPPLGEGEKYLSLIAKDLNMDIKVARAWIAKQELAGKLVSVGKRRTEKGFTVEAWRCV